MPLSKAQHDLLKQLETDFDRGLSNDEASKRRQDDCGFNVVDPPVNCPAWVCCLLPCIKNIPSMKLFRQVQPEDAEVLRDGKWVRYDAAGVVRGDIVRLEEGDIVPADCVCLTVGDENDEMLVDLRHITGEEKPRSVSVRADDGTVKPVQIFYGGHVVQGSGIVVVTAIGTQTLLASLLREGKWPPKENAQLHEEDDGHDEEAGISLMTRRDGVV